MKQQSQDQTIHIGVLPVFAPTSEQEKLKELIKEVADQVCDYLEQTLQVPWVSHLEAPHFVKDDDPRFASDYIDVSHHRMVEGPYDVLIIATDIPLLTRVRKRVPGLASPISRLLVITTRPYVLSPRGIETRSLDSPAVKTATYNLLLHLIGHLFKLSPTTKQQTVMNSASVRDMDHKRTFSKEYLQVMKRKIDTFPNRKEAKPGRWEALKFYLRSSYEHREDIFDTLKRSHALRIPLSLSRLTTAAMAPTLILLFSAEIWDVAFYLKDTTVWVAAVISVLISAWYLIRSLHLQFPRRENAPLSEHAAVVNVTTFITLTLAMCGLFLLLFLSMLVLEYFIFPEDLMREWPSLDNPTVNIFDQIRLAAFISILGVVTGALAGGLESRTVIREFALFREKV